MLFITFKSCIIASSRVELALLKGIVEIPFVSHLFVFSYNMVYLNYHLICCSIFKDRMSQRQLSDKPFAFVFCLPFGVRLAYHTTLFRICQYLFSIFFDFFRFFSSFFRSLDFIEVLIGLSATFQSPCRYSSVSASNSFKNFVCSLCYDTRSSTRLFSGSLCGILIISSLPRFVNPFYVFICGLLIVPGVSR